MTVVTMQVLLLLGFAATLINAEPTIIESHLESIFHPTGNGGKANIMITMSNRTDTVLAQISKQRFNNREERLTTLKTSLQKHASYCQAPVLNVLDIIFPEIKANSFWISNQIYIKDATKPIITLLRFLPGIAMVELEKTVYLNKTFVKGVERQDKELTYGVDKINAPDVWELGFTGQDIVVANIDSGVRLNHTTLKDRWRSDGYGWFDPANIGSEVPEDDNGHGTHTMGTMTGSGGIGVAPNATWIACKGCDANASCPASSLTKCGEWITCPTKPDGTEENCSKAPHVVNNSWGGGQNDTWYNEIIKAWTTAGIIHTFSAGNSGEKGCGSANSPADQDIAFSIGATDENDTLAFYSSLGPAISTNLIKPNISAPGTDVISASNEGDDLYATFSGTSMAAPHVAGVMALLLSKNPSLPLEEYYNALTQSAQQTGLTGNGQNCGGINEEEEFPNNGFGFGRVDALEAINSIQ